MAIEEKQKHTRWRVCLTIAIFDFRPRPDSSELTFLTQYCWLLLLPQSSAKQTRIRSYPGETYCWELASRWPNPTGRNRPLLLQSVIERRHKHRQSLFIYAMSKCHNSRIHNSNSKNERGSCEPHDINVVGSEPLLAVNGHFRQMMAAKSRTMWFCPLKCPYTEGRVDRDTHYESRICYREQRPNLAEMTKSSGLFGLGL